MGPLLFLAYINDMPECVRSKIKLFADDSLLYRIISNQSDCSLLLEDLDRVQVWEKRWQMSFNADKCEVLCISRISSSTARSLPSSLKQSIWEPLSAANFHGANTPQIPPRRRTRQKLSSGETSDQPPRKKRQ